VKTKLAVGLVLVLIVTLGLGCLPSKAIITGGGWLDECDSKVNFGFNVQATQVEGMDYDIKGQFQLVDHSTRPVTRIHGTFEGKFGSFAMGECMINGEGPHTFYLDVEDEGEPGVDDCIWVRIKIPGPDLYYSGKIDGGNIQIHEYHFN